MFKHTLTLIGFDVFQETLSVFCFLAGIFVNSGTEVSLAQISWRKYLTALYVKIARRNSGKQKISYSQQLTHELVSLNSASQIGNSWIVNNR